MKCKSFVLAGLVLVSSSVWAQGAGTATPGVDQRQANQATRIQQGVDSGQLNKREVRKLEKGQKKVARKEKKAKADGKVTKKERARINKAQNKQSARIAKQKNDAQQAKP